MSPATPAQGQNRGYVIPIGGAEAKRKDPVILERFVELCGGDDARILVIPTASLLDETGPLYQELFEGMGAKAMCIPIEERDDCYQDEILESLLYALEDGERSSDFVDVDENWLLSDMLAEVHVGHLNIAEAAIDMQGEPLSVDQMLAVVEDAVALDKNVSPAMRLTSLNHALDSDPRFDTVWQNDERYWFLARMEPPEVIAVPPLLRVQPVDYNRSLLSVELLQVEWELDDEWGESSLSSSVPSVVPNTSLMLTYPHRRYGTLPISGRTSSFFPQRSSGKSIVTLVDGRWGTRYSGWVYHSGRYVAGLGKWMDDHALPVGAFVTLERSNTPGEVVIDFRTRRAKREWARIASANLEEQRLIFEMNKIQVACEYDEYLITAESDREPIDRLRTDLDSMGVSLAQIVEQVVPELTKLNPQGTVHAKTVYSAVNILRRCPPGPVFYALISNRKFKDVGAGLFALA